MAQPGKRGRPSSIERLPDEAMPHVIAARDALIATNNKRTQDSIREELNLHLTGLGLTPISRTGFNRYALELMVMGERILKARQVAAVFAEQLSDEPGKDIGILTGEYMKGIIYEVIAKIGIDGEKFTMKDLAAASLSLMRIEAAKKMTVQSQVIRKTELAEEVDQAITKAATESGLSKQAVAQLRREFLGIVKKVEPIANGGAT